MPPVSRQQPFDRGSWEVTVAVGSTDCFDPDYAGAIDFLRVLRSSGSTLRPFLYALALERGTITPTTILDDLDRGVGGITNADERFLRPLLPRVALANSRNAPAANLLTGIGLDEGYGLLGELGLHDGSEPAWRYGLGLAIGGLPITLEELVRAYTVPAGDDRLQDLVWYRKQPRRLVSEETARQITLFLTDPQARLPSFPRMGWSEFPFAVAVKTGTSSRYRDAWTVAYSSSHLVGVWIGHPDFRPMARLSGYRASAQLVHRHHEPAPPRLWVGWAKAHGPAGSRRSQRDRGRTRMLLIASNEALLSLRSPRVDKNSAGRPRRTAPTPWIDQYR